VFSFVISMGYDFTYVPINKIPVVVHPETVDNSKTLFAPAFGGPETPPKLRTSLIARTEKTRGLIAGPSRAKARFTPARIFTEQWKISKRHYNGARFDFSV
jgi:hypothetical protein